MTRRMKVFGLIAALTLALSVTVTLTSAPPALAAAPGAIFSCHSTGQVDRIDPIVAPGVYPSAHYHQFYGGGPVGTTESSADLRTKSTSCTEQGNHSALWMPTVQEDSVTLQPGTTATGGGKQVLVYYRCRHDPSTCAAMQTFPDDFAFVEGNANATSAADNPAFDFGLGGWRCGTGGGTFYPTPPTTCSSGILVASVTFGNCLKNGVLTAQINDSCRNGGGQPIVRIQMYFRFWVGTGAVGTITLGGIGASPLTLHADYFFGWDTAVFESFLNKCIRANVDCGTNPTL